MQRLIALIFSIVFFATAQAAEISSADREAFRNVVAGQLEAFRTDDGPRAYSFAAPLITKMYPTVDIFMTMVKRGYDPVFKNSTFQFGALESDATGRPAQHVLLSTADGKRYEAIYFMEKQKDGTWKISGVQLILVQGLDA